MSGPRTAEQLQSLAPQEALAPTQGIRVRAELLALASILLGAAAQLVVKAAFLLAAGHGNGRVPQAQYQAAAGVLCGMAVYAAGTWFWLKAVARAAISYLYPLSACTYVLVAFGGRFLFGEHIQSGRWIGIGIITAGVALLALSERGGVS